MQWTAKNSHDFKEEKKEIAILPIGAVEAHGPHLPIGTDNILAEKLANMVAEKTKAHVLPILPFGQVWSLKNFPGSITIKNDSLTSLVVDLGESIYEQGFHTFAVVNAHLGNQSALKEASRILLEKMPNLKVFTFFYPDIQTISGEIRQTEGMHHTFFHADEIETSIMLYLAEESVDMGKAITDIPTIPSDIDFTPTPWEEFTNSAVLGDATKATKEKGKRIVDHAVKRMVEMLHDKI